MCRLSDKAILSGGTDRAAQESIGSAFIGSVARCQKLVVGGPAWGPEPPPRYAVYEVGASSLVGAAACSAGDTAVCSAGGCSATGSAGCGAACWCVQGLGRPRTTRRGRHAPWGVPVQSVLLANRERSMSLGAIAFAEGQADHLSAVLNLARSQGQRFGPLHRKSLLGPHASQARSKVVSAFRRGGHDSIRGRGGRIWRA
jgi:hypothetical protein